MPKGLTIFDAVKKFGWPKPGEEIISRELILGDFCNAHCLFCCTRGLSDKAKWLPESKIKAYLKTWANEGAWLITLSGGEVTLYPHLERIAEYAKHCGFKFVQLLTNGLKLKSKRYVQRLADSGINEIKISLHGIDAKTHDYLMQVPGSFANAFVALENINAAGIKASFNFAITARNYKQMPLFAKLAGIKLGLTGFCFMFSFYSGGMLEESGNLGISYSEVLPYLRLALRYMKAKGIAIESKMLSNFVPCLAPELMNLMSDWCYGAPESGSKAVIGGKLQLSNENYPQRKAKLPSCDSCIYSHICYGPDKGYVAVYGDKEFIPLKKYPKRFPYETLYA